MAYQIKLGANAWDAVAFVRNQIEDVDPTSPVISDAAFKAYLEDVIEDFERWVPLQGQVGNPYNATSPFMTVAGQRRYLCNQASGFTDASGSFMAPTRITDVLYRADGAYSSAAEMAYLMILPFSPMSAFMMEPDVIEAPTQRYFRDSAFNELSHYGSGYTATVIDAATGLNAIDLYPTPVSAGLPIFVKYNATYTVTTDTQGNGVIANLPESKKRYFARLLLATVRDQEAQRLTKAWDSEIGIVKERGDARGLREEAARVRQSVYEELGSAVPAADVSN